VFKITVEFIIHLDTHGLPIKSGAKAWSLGAPRFTGLGIEVNSNQSDNMYLTLLFNPEQGIPCSGKRTFRLVSLKHTIEKKLLRSKERQDARDQNHTLHGRDQSVRIPGMAYPECMSPPNTSIDLCIISTDSHQNSPVFANTKIILVPTFQGGIMQMNDNRPPFSVKSTQNSHAHLHQRKY